MGRKFYKVLRKGFIILLTLVLLVQAVPVTVFAEESGIVCQYIKDVKVITAESADKAKEIFEKNGYTMIEENLNDGTGEDALYMGYTTTTDSSEAITDIKVMNMKGGFKLTNYQKEVFDEQYMTPLNEMAEQFGDAVAEFKENYKKGYTGAKYAYLTLNYFVVDGADGADKPPVQLGDYFLKYDLHTGDFLKMITLCHISIIGSIFSVLSLGVQEPAGNGWVERLSKAGPEISTEDLELYYDKAKDIYDVMHDFAGAYNLIDHNVYSDKINVKEGVGTDHKGYTAEESSKRANTEAGDILYEIAVATLRNYDYGNGLKDEKGNIRTVAEVFTNVKMNEKSLIPLVKSLTPGQYAMLRMGGPLNMILYSGSEESYYEDFQAKFDEATSEISSCSIWAGVDFDVFNNTIAVTEEAAREMADTKAYGELVSDADTFNDTLEHYTNLVCAITSALAALCKITSGVLAALSVPTAAVSTAATSVCTGSSAAAFLTSASSALGTVTLVVTVAIWAYLLVCKIIDWYKYYHPDYTEIPTYMYDVVVDNKDRNVYVQYQCVTDFSEKNMDLNYWQGKEWVAVYVSRRQEAGKPIEADFTSKTGDGRTPNGYTPLTNFGRVRAENLNQYDYDDDMNGIYLFYKQNNNSDSSQEQGVKYIQNVFMQTGKSEFECTKALEDMGYTVLNINLTPDSPDKTYTYIGYTLTTKRAGALKDIRICDGYKAGSFIYGSASYGEHGTSDGMTLYATKMDIAGNPIRELTVKRYATEFTDGYEPVNLFSGGPAYNINNHAKYQHASYEEDPFKGYYLGFLPKDPCTTGPDYLGGINFIVSSNYGDAANVDAKGTRELLEFMGYTDFSENLVDSKVCLEKNINESFTCFAMTTTKNKKRAIQNIGAITYSTELADENDFMISQNINFGGYSYSAADQFHYIYLPIGKLLTGVPSKGGTADSISNVTQRGFELNRKNPVSSLYVTGCIPDLKPLEIADLQFTTSPEKEENYEPKVPVYDFYGKNNAVPANINGLNIDIKCRTDCYLYYNNKNNVTTDGKYVSALSLYDKTALRMLYENAKVEIRNSDISTFQVKHQLAQTGATTIFDTNINPQIFSYDNNLQKVNSLIAKSKFFDSSNITLLGMRKTDRTSYALTDVKLFITDGSKPPRTQTINNIVYTLCSEVHVYRRDSTLEEFKSKLDPSNYRNAVHEYLNLTKVTYPGCYLYATTNPAAGARITDILVDNNPIITGYETVRTSDNNEEKVLYLCEEGTYIHLRREDYTDKEYVSDVYAVSSSEGGEEAICRLAEMGCTDVINYDLNKDAGGDYVYLGYTRTDNEDNALRNMFLYSSEDSFTRPSMIGYTYHMACNGLNFNEKAGGTYITLYASKNKKDGEPVISLSVSNKPVNDSGRGGISTVKLYDHGANNAPFDLNYKAGGEYIYLNLHRKVYNNLLGNNIISGTLVGQGSGGVLVHFGGSVIGNGSVVMIIIFSGIFVAAGVLIIILKYIKTYKKKNK